MLEASNARTLDTQPAQDSVHDSMQGMRALIERMQAELQFEKTRIEALNFEIARLKRWRFGSSSESLEASTQAALFDAIVADTLLEDIAAQQEARPAPAAPRAKGRAVRQALPASLPRIDRHHEIEATHCACGQAFKRIGEEVSEQLDCVPAQFFVLRHIRGLTGAGAPPPDGRLRVLPDHSGCADARADDRQGHPKGPRRGPYVALRACPLTLTGIDPRPLTQIDPPKAFAGERIGGREAELTTRRGKRSGRAVDLI